MLAPKDVERAVAGTGAVLSALGHTKTSSKDVLTEGTKNIVAAMNEHGVRRLVSLTGAGVRDPKDEPKLVDRRIGSLLKLLQRDPLEDAMAQARVIRESDLEWVIVRAPVLNEGVPYRLRGKEERHQALAGRRGRLHAWADHGRYLPAPSTHSQLLSTGQHRALRLRLPPRGRPGLRTSHPSAWKGRSKKFDGLEAAPRGV